MIKTNNNNNNNKLIINDEYLHFTVQEPWIAKVQTYDRSHDSKRKEMFKKPDKVRRHLRIRRSNG